MGHGRAKLGHGHLPNLKHLESLKYELTFGKHRGHSCEWLFFNDLNYLRWLIREQIPYDSNRFSEAAAKHLETLVYRSEHILPPCSNCGARRESRMIADDFAVKFRCRECDPLYFTPLRPEEPLKPSFLIYDSNARSISDAALIAGIKKAFFSIPPPLLTEEHFEAFFDNPANFSEM